MNDKTPIVDLPKPGERISIHPASDWFMRGERYATVIKTVHSLRIRVQGERSGKRFWITADHILEIL